MTKNLVCFVILLIIAISCNKPKVLKAELNASQTFPPGEWISKSDSLSGLSIREDKLAFFKNMQFSSENICKYKIFDSVEYTDEKKIILSSYLVTNCEHDTITYKIEIRNDSLIQLKLKESKSEVFKLKQK